MSLALLKRLFKNLPVALIYNHTGWLGVKHQFTYLFFILFLCLSDHRSSLNSPPPPPPPPLFKFLCEWTSNHPSFKTSLARTFPFRIVHPWLDRRDEHLTFDELDRAGKWVGSQLGGRRVWVAVSEGQLQLHALHHIQLGLGGVVEPGHVWRHHQFLKHVPSYNTTVTTSSWFTSPAMT